MTLPDERYRAVVQTRRFLLDLCNREHTPRVPKLIRDTARSMLRHYPSDYDMNMASQTSPNVFQERMEDLHKFLLKGKEMKAEEITNQLSLDELASISDEALDSVYHYGRSTPGENFGWRANVESAKAASKLIYAGVTDIERISSAIHEGWNITAIADYMDELQLNPPTPQDKKAKRYALAQKTYAQLPEDEKEKDRVVARALLKAIKGI